MLKLTMTVLDEVLRTVSEITKGHLSWSMMDFITLSKDSYKVTVRINSLTNFKEMPFHISSNKISVGLNDVKIPMSNDNKAAGSIYFGGYSFDIFVSVSDSGFIHVDDVEFNFDSPISDSLMDISSISLADSKNNRVRPYQEVLNEYILISVRDDLIETFSKMKGKSLPLGYFELNADKDLKFLNDYMSDVEFAKNVHEVLARRVRKIRDDETLTKKELLYIQNQLLLSEYTVPKGFQTIYDFISYLLNRISNLEVVDKQTNHKLKMILPRMIEPVDNLLSMIKNRSLFYRDSTKQTPLRDITFVEINQKNMSELLEKIEMNIQILKSIQFILETLLSKEVLHG